MILINNWVLALVVVVSFESFVIEGSSCLKEKFPEAERVTNKIVKKRDTNNSVEKGSINSVDTTLVNSINRHIRIELFAYYNYLSMAYYFDSSAMKMDGFHQFFLKMAKEEHEHAEMFMKYLNKRGWEINLKDIMAPCKNGGWENGKAAMSEALKLEEDVYEELVHLHNTTKNDIQFEDFLVSNFLGEQVDSIKQLKDYVETLKRLGTGVGEYHFDKMTLQDKN